MRRWLPWIGAAVAAAALVHVVVIYAMPWTIMGIAMRTIAAGNGFNRVVHPPRADERSRTIVRPSPDLLYATCVFDVSERPLRFTAEVPPDTYWSLSMFAANTDNFYKINDREAVGGKVDVVLAAKGMAVDLPPGATRVDAPTSRGIALTRTLIDDEARLAEIEAARRRFSCAPL